TDFVSCSADRKHHPEYPRQQETRMKVETPKLGRHETRCWRRPFLKKFFPPFLYLSFLFLWSSSGFLPVTSTRTARPRNSTPSKPSLTRSTLEGSTSKNE